MLKANRECDGCTACCDGTLAGVAYNEKYQGNKCHFNTGTGCAIYENRPEKPCKTFKCEWLMDDTFVFPESLKPNLSGFILLTRNDPSGKRYLLAVASRDGVNQEALMWLIDWANRKKQNISVQFSYKKYYIGTTEFRKLFKQ